MQIRCYRCNWSFSIDKNEIAFVLEALEESGGKHHDAQCPRCRRTTKIPVKQLRRAAPRSVTEEEKGLEVEQEVEKGEEEKED